MKGKCLFHLFIFIIVLTYILYQCSEFEELSEKPFEPIEISLSSFKASWCVQASVISPIPKTINRKVWFENYRRNLSDITFLSVLSYTIAYWYSLHLKFHLSHTHLPFCITLILTLVTTQVVVFPRTTTIRKTYFFQDLGRRRASHFALLGSWHHYLSPVMSKDCDSILSTSSLPAYLPTLQTSFFTVTVHG